MVERPVRVGIVGANPDYGWGSGVHRRVVAMLPELSLEAVCTTREDSARQAAEAFGARHWFTDPAELARHADVDLVAICVKAPHHYGIARDALLAGKHVYCEWPLAFTVGEAEELASLANTCGVKAIIGLHLRGCPAMQQAAALVAEGFVGKVFNVSVQARLFGPQLRAMALRAGGTTLMSIYGGHLLDALDHFHGGIAEIEARSAIHLPPIDETGAPLARDAADHIQYRGILNKGALFDVNLSGVGMADMGSQWRIDGNEGTLLLTTRDASLPAIEALSIKGARTGELMRDIAIEPRFDCADIPAQPDRYHAYPGAPASREALVSIGNLYRSLTRAINGEGLTMPDFGRACEIQMLLERIDDRPLLPVREPAPAGA